MSVQTLILNAQDALELAKKNVSDEKQHEMVGYNLAQACELFMKAICEMRGLEYPRDNEGHDLDNLMEILEEGGFSAISSHEDVIGLTVYNSTSSGHHVRDDDRLDLEEMIVNVEELKKLTGKALKEH
ncbi:HEPN domain protein [compost metagenome]